MTRNADLPAMPQTNQDNLCLQTGMPKHEHSGLSKREDMAKAFCSAILSSPHYLDICTSYRYNDEDCDYAELCAKAALFHVDKLLAELEKTK